MRLYSIITLLPLAAAIPTFRFTSFQPPLPDLTTTDFSIIQSILGGASPAEAAEGILSSLREKEQAIVDKEKDWFSIQDDDKEKTIWQLLNEDQEKYSKLIKLLLFDGKAKDVLDDGERDITIFAPENSGIPDPHDGDDDDGEDMKVQLIKLHNDPSINNLWAFYSRNEEFLLAPCKHHRHRKVKSAFWSMFGYARDDDDDDEERKKKIFKAILHIVLKYHALPKGYSGKDLANNSTWPTVLKGFYGSSDGEPLRIRVEGKLIPPSLKINFFSKTTESKQAKNGWFHGISHPLLPPPSLLQEAFYFSDMFSTLTSAIQKVHGQKYVDWDIDREKLHKEHKVVFNGSPALTLFAPTNEAFAALPPKLRLFLFSPFGEHILAKLLAYHVLPDQILFLESYHKVQKDSNGDKLDLVHVFDDDASFHFEKSFKTGLNNTEVKIIGDKSRVVPLPGAYKTSLNVGGVDVSTIDVPALNGVGHAIPQVLKPPHKHKDDKLGIMVESQWEDWEDWLVDWAQQV